MIYVNLLTLSSISIYSLLISGWASNSKFAFLGYLWAYAQMISYEIWIGLIIINIIFYSLLITGFHELIKASLLIIYYYRIT